MNLQILLLFGFVTAVYSKALDESLKFNFDEDTEGKVRDKRFSSALDSLVKSGAVKEENSAKEEEKPAEKNKRTLDSKASLPKVPAIPLDAVNDHELPPGHRVKKQSPNNVCIKLQDCGGKTACGPLVSAYGPVTADLRAMMQGKNPPMTGEMRGNVLDEVDMPAKGMMPPMDFRSGQAMPTMDFRNGQTMPPMDFRNAQSKTVDLFGYNPLAFGGFPSSANTAATSTAIGNSYGNSGSYGSSSNYGGSSGYGVSGGAPHSFFKPPEPIPAPINYGYQHPIHPLHALLYQHPGLSPHRLDLSRLQDLLYTPPEIRQPVYVPQPAYISHSYDTPLICQPLRNKKYQDFAQDKIDKVEPQTDDKIDKIDRIDEKNLAAVNATPEEAKNVDSSEYYYEGKSIQEHLRRINEIKDQISQLNRAAQRIVDQQERLAEMQQRHMYRSNNGPQQFQRNNNEYEERNIPPYYGGGYGGGYGGYGGYPGGYFRSSGQSATSYPNSQEDTEFFINLMHQLKRMGMLSNSFQQSIIAPVDDKTGQKKSQDDDDKDGKEQGKQSETLASDLVYGDKQKQTSSKNDKNKNKQQSSMK